MRTCTRTGRGTGRGWKRKENKYPSLRIAIELFSFSMPSLSGRRVDVEVAQIVDLEADAFLGSAATRFVE